MDTSVPIQSNRYWGWFLAYGIILVILGVLAIGASTLATLVSVVMLGTLLVIGGIVIIFDSFRFWKTKWGGFFLQLVMGLLYLIIGYMLIKNPVSGATSLTLFLGVFFIVLGLCRIIASISVKLPYWGWRFVSGVLSLALGALILAHWPMSGLFIIGLFIGIDLLFTGWTYIVLSLASRAPKVPS